MNAQPLISICIPSYNQTVFLRKTLESLLEQTWKYFEVVISDDSTTNNVKILVDEFSQRLPLVYHKNAFPLGSPANWNKALELAKGDLIKFMHHDDWFARPDALALFADAFVKDPETGMAFCSSEILNVSENSISFNRPPSQFIEMISKNPLTLFNDNRIGSPSAVMYKRNTLRFDERLKYVVDIDFYIRLLSQNSSFTFISEPLIVNTSHHPGQVTTASMNKETQVGEYVYLYHKLFNGRRPGKALSRFFVSLFRKYGVKHMDELELLGGVEVKPAWYFKILLFRSRF